MSEPLQFAILGLGMGSLYALLAAGLVLIYRGSGTINLAHGHLAILSAYLTYELRDVNGQATAVALPLALAATGVAGIAIHLLVMRPLRHASSLARIIGTLGVLTIINEGINLKFGSTEIAATPLLPTDPLHFAGLVVGRQSLWLAMIAIAVTICLTAVMKRTRLGLAVSASAESPRAAAALGWSPDAMSMATWAAGGTLAGLAGALVPSTTSGFFTEGALSTLIIGALATALFAEFKSFPMALIAGWSIAVIQSETVRYVSFTGAADAVPFLVIVVMLTVRGTNLPIRGTLSERLPSVGTGRVRILVILAAAGGALAITMMALDASTQFTDLQALAISACMGLVALSIVVLTGYTGQLSLAQMALAGIGAYAAGRLAATEGWPFPIVAAAGVGAATLAGLVFAIPALRTRGVNLTVVTFGMGFAVYAALFSNSALTGGNQQTQVPSNLSVFGIPVDSSNHLNNYAAICMIALVGCAVMVANLRRGNVGRELLAVRANERAAASLGVNVFAAKLYAFGLSAAIAGLGGVLYAFLYQTILYQQLFGPFTSISVLTIAVIGGIGWVMGPFWGSILATGGIGVALAANLSGQVEKYIPIASGFLLIVLLIISQNGIAAAITVRLTRRRPASPEDTPRLRAGAAASRVKPQTLAVHGVTQRFGGVTALSEVSVSVAPGMVVGLLGPNGAGKTTLIDVITGYTRPVAGTVHLEDREVTRSPAYRRARLGVARTFQGLELFDDLTVRENLLTACEDRRALDYVGTLIWPKRRELSPTALAAVEMLDLAGTLNRTAGELSYGQRRLVAIARAVASGPSVLLLDEPGAGLDQTESAELGGLIRRLADDWGMAILLIEHDVPMVLRTSDQVHVLDFGRMIFAGPPAELTRDEGVRAAYLGDTGAGALQPAETPRS